MSHAHSIPGIEDLIDEIPISTRTLTSILDEFKVTRLDFLIVDAEGYDGEIVRSFPFDRLHPKLVLYETKHLSRQDRSQTELVLREAGYSCLHMKDWEDNIYAVSHELMSGDEVRFIEEVISDNGPARTISLPSNSQGLKDLP